jgi:transmembrane sensor
MENRDEAPGVRDDAVDWDRLARYLAGESSAAEADEVRGWLANDPARGELLRALGAALELAADPAPAGLDVDAALGRVHARMDEDVERPVIPFRPRRHPARVGWSAPALRMAAAVLLLIGGAFLAMRMVRGAGDASSVQAFSTAVGERDSVRLPDGTRVLLGPGSRLTYAEDYGRERREVHLRGEAMFDVRHDAARPFAVRAGGVRVRDIGTAFTVRTGPGGEVRVVVTSGSVAVRSEAQPASAETVLRRGDRATMNEGHVRAQRAAATPEDLAWTRGELVFRDAPLDQVAADVRRWYGIELRADDPAVAGRRLTASFGDEPREQVVRVIALALGAEAAVRGDTAVLRDGAPR